MRIRSRMIAAIIILTLSIGLVGPLGVAQALPTEQYPVTISIGGDDRVLFANHTSGLKEGNWIELSGGTTVKLPSLKFIYAGQDVVSYTKDGVTVTMDPSFIPDLVKYPLSTHQVYKPEQHVSATFWGSPELDKDVVFMLLRVSSLSEIRDVLNEVFEGDIGSLLASLVGDLHLDELNSAGDVTYGFNAPKTAGDYILVVAKIDLKIPLINSKFYIYSATAIEVVDYTLDISAAPSVEKGDALSVGTTLIGAPTVPYIYGFAMIREDSYRGRIELSTEGTVASTKLYFNDILMADGSLFTKFYLGTNSQSDLNITFIEETLIKAFDPDELSFAHSTTGSTALPTSSLKPGKYVLLVGVWSDWTTRIVGLGQTTVNVVKPYKPSPTPPKNQKPTADAGPNQKISKGSIIHFSGAGSSDPDGYIINYNWDFGDGTTVTGPEFAEVDHTYSESGLYSVTLTVKDNRLEEDSDTCEVMVWEWPAPVADKFGQLVPGEQKGFTVNASKEANTTVTLDTTDNVTVTVLRYEGNPHPGDPIPAMALPIYVDVEVSNPDAVVWPIYVEISYTDEQVGMLDEHTFGIYYWFNGTWQRCSNTGVDTEKNIVWAYMTAHEASGSPILIAGMHAIPTPPLPPFLSDLTVTPPELEQGDDVTISVDIMNPNDIAISYRFEMQIGELILLVDVELEAYESKTVSRTLTMYTAGEYTVTVDGMTGSFTVEAPEIPLKPAEFVLSDLTITPEEIELGEGIDVWSFRITVNVANVGEQEGTHTVDLKVDGDVIQDGTVILWGGEETMIIFDVTRGVGSYTVEVEGLTGSFTVTAHPKPAEFEVSELDTSPEASSERPVEEGEDVTFTVKVTNIGETEGSYTVEFKVDGETIETETVTLAGGESTTVTFEGAWSAGTYKVNVEDLTKTFRVSKKPIKPFWTRPGYAAGILILVASAAAVIYYLWKGKHLSTLFSGSK